MADKNNDIGVQKPGTVLHTDNHPIDQPKGTTRYALNAVNEASDGQHKSLSNEGSNYAVSEFKEGFHPIGDEYLGDDLEIIIQVNPTTGEEEIGTLSKSHTYTPVVETKVLGLSITNQCQLTFRLRRGNERVIYWVDGLNKARTFNLDRVHNFYNNAYKTYLKAGGNPATYAFEKYDASSFDLQKTYKSIPFFADAKIIETGNILPGSYNFAIQYVDEDLNPTEWITTSNTVRIFNDTINTSYERIRGSKNITSLAQTFDRANKSIKLTITNLDSDFPYYRVAIIRAAGLNGLPEKVLASELYSTSDGNFTYSGNDSQLTEVQLGDILIEREVIYAPKHIEQIENRLTLHHTKGKSVNWCEFQKYASKIGSNLVTKEVILNSPISEPNLKSAKSTFLFRGYMPGEVYSFGIAYLFNDGYISPVFHIPGKSDDDTTGSLMKVYEGDNRYLDIHNCSTDNYWGKDINGDTLVAKKHRHHRFPFRKEVSKPLFTRSTSTTAITKYKLVVNIALAVGQTYPVDSNGDPLPISYAFNFQVTGATGQTQLVGTLVDTDMGEDIELYNDITQLDDLTPGIKGELEPTSTLATSYMVSGSEVFTITFTYTSEVVDKIRFADQSEIFGIEFGNIEKPHPDVVGFYIVRNERTEDDKLIVDNAVFGPMTQYQDYKSFGLWTPKQFFTATNCGQTNGAGKTLQYFNKGVWFFNPEFQFFNKKTDYDAIEVEGVYTEASTRYPTLSNKYNSECNHGKSKGLYLEDVQAGTSYNPDVHKKKDKDDDGFDLLVGYKVVDFTYATNTTLIFPAKRFVLYLNAASYQNIGADIFYNVSIDNKIGEYITDDPLDTTIQETLFNTTTKKNSLIYGSLVKNNGTAYSNFITKSYYKEHNNPVYFGSNTIINGVKIFNGDTEISALHMVTSVFYDIVVADRSKKSRVWKIIIGALLVIASVAAIIATGGAATPLAALGISYGVSLASSGIKFEQMKSMIDEDYEKGLRETVNDGGVFQTIREYLSNADDTIRWFSDRASNIYIESSVPFGLRSGLTSGVSDFMDAPAPYDEQAFRTYLTEKFTVVDRDQGSGRLYKGYAGAEFYDMNKDYLRFNKEKLFIHLPVEYDCCSDKNEVYPTRIWYSEQSFQEERVDNYRIFLPNNYKDIEGEHGEITNAYRLGNNLFIECREVLWQLPRNNQERVTGEIVSFIGTGDFFSLPPIKVMDDSLGSGGTQHKWATLKTLYGVISVNEIKNKIYLHAEGIKDLTVGNSAWFTNNLRPFLKKQLYDLFGVEYLHDNNPANPYGIGYHSTYDTRYKRALITKIDYQVLQTKIPLLSVVTSIPTSGNAFVYCQEDGHFYKGTTILSLLNSDYFENKSWTLSYSFKDNGFISWHSYIPNYYIHSQNNLYMCLAGDNKIYRHNKQGHYQTFFGKYAPFIVRYISSNNPIMDKMLEDITIITTARKWDEDSEQFIEQHLVTFNKITCNNGKQCTGELIMRVKQSQTPDSWYQNQISNDPGIILIDRNIKDWNINRLRDYVVDYDKSLFTNDWSILKFYYPLDRVVNPLAVNFNKTWSDLAVLKDKYVEIELKFDNFNDVNLVFNLALDTKPDVGK
jgi:hypothetical protein